MTEVGETTKLTSGRPATLTPTTHAPDHTPETVAEVESLGVSLGPALHDACGDRLGDIEWFRSSWQKSGAATGRTWWRLPDGTVIDAIAKVPVGYREYYWSTHIGGADPMQWGSVESRSLPTPRVLAAGSELGGYDVAWLVVERIPGKTIRKNLGIGALEKLFTAAVRFHKLAGEIREPRREDRPMPPAWGRLLQRSREACEVNPVPDGDRWVRAIRWMEDRVDPLVAFWDSRPIDTWCHGDLHPGNVMIRPDGDLEHHPVAVLLDLGLMHAGCWIEDALYFERQHWGREEALCGIDPYSTLACKRLEAGLPLGDRHEQLASVRRALMAATSPAFLDQEGDPRYLAAALGLLERLQGDIQVFMPK